MIRSDPSHRCPGHCGRVVPDHLFACRSCWYRLPLDLRRAISRTAHRSLLDDERQQIVSDAVEFYASAP